MPGTGLARDRGTLEQFAWTYVLPLLRIASSGMSTPERSAAVLAELLSGQLGAPGTGLHFDFSRAQTPTSAGSKRRDWAADLYTVSARLANAAAVPVQSA